ncbi:MAG: ABC transporter permease [Candidatus Kerfeldbacteria bacterium]|nr:ABC transporter permease [Candidatus Kerfeldbacteria bacterium]
MMMSWYRIYALILRHSYPLRRDFDLLNEMLYWPIIDTITWGFTSVWMTQNQNDTRAVVFGILFALVLWNIIWRSQSEVSRNLMDEVWNANLVNLFSTPIKISEWVISVLIQSVVKMCITSGAVIGTIFLLYTLNMFTLGWWVLPFFLNAMISGWSIGFVSAGIVMRFGPKVQSIIWSLPGIFFPLCAVYFPLAQLPEQVQRVSALLPPTYIFETMRSLVYTGTTPKYFMFICAVLNICYIFLAIWFFVRSFAYSKKRNLARFN